jgi:hypothetical protein
MSLTNLNNSLYSLNELLLLEIIDFLDIKSLLSLSACSELLCLLSYDIIGSRPMMINKQIQNPMEILKTFDNLQSLPSFIILYGTTNHSKKQQKQTKKSLIELCSFLPPNTNLMYAECAAIQVIKNNNFEEKIFYIHIFI